MKTSAIILLFLLLPAKVVLAYEFTPKVSLSVSEQYNDNIFLRNSDRTGDFITYLSPGIDLSFKSVNSELMLNYSPTFSFYSSHEELNDTAHHIMANGNFTLSNRLNLTLTETFVKSNEIQDIRAIPDLGPVTNLTEVTSNTVSSNMSYKLTDNISYTIGASYFFIDYKQPGFSDVTTYSGNMGLTYRQSERTTLSVNARYVSYDYELTSDATEQDYIAGISYKLTTTLTAVITGGPIITKIKDTGRSDTNFGGGVDLTKTFNGGQATLSYRQAIAVGTETNVAEPLREQRISLDLSKFITNKINMHMSGSFSSFKSIETNDTNTDEILLSADLTYSFLPWADMLLSYSYAKNNDKVTTIDDYYNHIVMLTLRLSYNRKP